MSNTSTFPTVTADFAQQSTNATSSQALTPPLLPAFLITGLLLAAIVSIIAWRHIIERRNVRREDDPTWPIEGVVDGGGPKGPTPTIWDLKVRNESEWATWEDIMPLSATALRAAPKPRRPRYLIPSDRPVTFFTRMFGGERRPSQPAPPPISVLAPTQTLPHVAPPYYDEDEEPIDRLQVAVLISLPHPRRVRHNPLFVSEKDKEDVDIRSPPPAQGDMKPIKEGLETEDASLSCKGKKRSLESPSDQRYHLKTSCDYDGEDGLSEVAFGIVMMPFVEEE